MKSSPCATHGTGLVCVPGFGKHFWETNFFHWRPQVSLKTNQGLIVRALHTLLECHTRVPLRPPESFEERESIRVGSLQKKTRWRDVKRNLPGKQPPQSGPHRGRLRGIQYFGGTLRTNLTSAIYLAWLTQ